MRNIVKLVVVLAFLMAGVLIAGISRRTLRGTSSFEMGTTRIGHNPKLDTNSFTLRRVYVS